MSSNKRNARLRNLQLARIQTETKKIEEESASADVEIEALERQLSELKEKTKRVESSTHQAKWQNNKVLRCRDCKQKCNTTTKKPVALKCRHTMCLPCFWRINVARRDLLQRINPRPFHDPVWSPRCSQYTPVPFDLTERNVPKSHATLQVLKICETD